MATKLPQEEMVTMEESKHPPSKTMSSIYAKRKALEDKLEITDLQNKE
jgi:hypothetical protein